MYDAAHLAELIATLGPPPPAFKRRNKERAADFWDDQGSFNSHSQILPLQAINGKLTRNAQVTGWVWRRFRKTGAWRSSRIDLMIARVL